VGRPCASCTHPRTKEIDRKFRSGDTIENVVRWLREIKEPVSVNALARHRSQHVMGVVAAPLGGPKPVSGSFLQAVVDKAWASMEDGTQTPTIAHAIAASSEINRQADKVADRDMMARIALMMAPAYIEGEFRELAPEVDNAEVEMRKLLLPGD
jgi:hypothetical protein